MMAISQDQESDDYRSEVEKNLDRLSDENSRALSTLARYEGQGNTTGAIQLAYQKELKAQLVLLNDFYKAYYNNEAAAEWFTKVEPKLNDMHTHSKAFKSSVRDVLNDMAKEILPSTPVISTGLFAMAKKHEMMAKVNNLNLSKEKTKHEHKLAMAKAH